MQIKDSKWEMLDNYVGMRPKFEVICTQCLVNAFLDYSSVPGVSFKLALSKTIDDLISGKFGMVLREAFCSPLPVVGEKAYHNDMHYKCAHSDGCDKVEVFGVPIDEEYYNVLMQRRQGNSRVLPREDWDKDEDIKKQLKGLGYI
jgi:hypothetical protein